MRKQLLRVGRSFKRRFRGRFAAGWLAAVLLLGTAADARAQRPSVRVPVLPATGRVVLTPPPALVPAARPAPSFMLRDHDLHPDVLYRPYLGGPFLGDRSDPAWLRRRAFQEILDLYVARQGDDDNFTLRVIDKRDGGVLERYTMAAERARYEREGKADWPAVDDLRRTETRRLVDKHAARGVPRDAIAVRWGRSDQIREAHAADVPYLAYELRLARYLGLSLMATEIGTVETFNRDDLVSSVGARGRYQMMPYMLRQNGVHHYRLRTATGRAVNVFEERHPLLLMEPAFVTLRAYANAVGHELPGLSAYHAGPGNLFMIYRRYLESQANRLPAGAGVVDAFVWALTDGFEAVSSGSSFGSYSRGYVPSVYGSLRATELMPADTSSTMLAERVRLRPGREVFLSHLLTVLVRGADRLGRGDEALRLGLYDWFRALNPHMGLPDAEGGGVPVDGDVRLESSVDGHPVRFFLPRGASQLLAEAGVDLLDEDALVVFDHDTYAPPYRERTEWDAAYDRLVLDAGAFGFTAANRARLATLRQRFEALARESPTPYRRMQVKIIRLHEQLWQSAAWDKLSEAVASAGLADPPPAEDDTSEDDTSE